MKSKLPVSNEFQLGDCLLLYISDPENVLGQNHQDYLSDVLQVVASRAFGREVSRDSIPRHAIVDQSYLLLLEFKQTLVGFAGVRDNPDGLNGLTFLSGIAILPEQQGKGLGRGIFQHLLQISDCNTLAFTTQSPIMYSLLHKMSKVVYPGTEGCPIPSELQEIGSQIMKDREGKFCPTTFVDRNLYSQCLYPEFPWYSDSQTNSFFRQTLHFRDDETRDAFLLVGEIK